MEDAASYGDVNVNTLRSVSASPRFRMPNMRDLGLFDIDGVVTEGGSLKKGSQQAAVVLVKGPPAGPVKGLAITLPTPCSPVSISRAIRQYS